MTSLERVMTVINGGLPDRVPVALHNFMMAVDEAGVAMSDYRTNPEATAQAHLHAHDKYGHDCIMVDLDTTMLAEAMGATAECAANEPGRITRPAIESLDDVGRLRVVDPFKDGRVPFLLEAVHLIRKATGSRVAIRGNADQCAFSLASLVRGMQDFLMDLATQPDHPGIGRLLDLCHESHLATHRALMKAGAHFTSLGDSPAGPDVISPDMFARYARPYHERLLHDLRRDGIFTVIHICGNTSSILPALAEYEYCGFELDYKTDAAQAKATAGRKHVLFGNIDPSAVLARGTEEDVTQASERLLTVWKHGGGCVLNAGCGIPAGTPPANLAALVRAAREFGTL